MSDEIGDVGEAGGEVEFVGGVPVEQTLPGDSHSDEKAAAVKAVKAALAKDKEENPPSEDDEDVHEDDDSGPSAEDVKPKAKAKEEEIDPDTAAVKQVLNQRKKLAQAKQAQQKEFDQARAQMQAYHRQILADKAAAEQAHEKLRRLKGDPASAVREFYGDPEKFIMDLAQSGTPEGQMEARFRAMQEQLESQKAWQANQLEQQKQAYLQQQEQMAIQHRAKAEKDFTGVCINEEKFPHLSDFFSGREDSLVREGDLVAIQYRELTGKEASYEDIAEYLEEQLAERAQRLYTKKYGTRKVSVQSNQAPSAKAKTGTEGRQTRPGSKTINQAAGSERRALAPRLEDLDDEGRILAARQAVKVALANSKQPEE